MNTEWVTYTFSSSSFRPRDPTGVCCIAGGFFASWATRDTERDWSAELQTKKCQGLTITTRWRSGKDSACQCRCGLDLWVRKILWSRKWQPTPVSLLGKFHGEEPGGLQSMGSQRVGHDWATKHTRRHQQLGGIKETSPLQFQMRRSSMDSLWHF